MICVRLCHNNRYRRCSCLRLQCRLRCGSSCDRCCGGLLRRSRCHRSCDCRAYFCGRFRLHRDACCRSGFAGLRGFGNACGCSFCFGCRRFCGYCRFRFRLDRNVRKVTLMLPDTKPQPDRETEASQNRHNEPDCPDALLLSQPVGIPSGKDALVHLIVILHMRSPSFPTRIAVPSSHCREAFRPGALFSS